MVTISSHIDGFIVARSYCPNSATQRRTLLRQFVRSVGDIPPADIGLPETLAWWESLEHLSDATRKAHLATVRLFLDHLVETGAIATNPARSIKSPVVHLPPPVTLTARQVSDVLVSARSLLDRAIILLMLGSGLRSSDVAALRIEDIDRPSMVFTVKGKGGKTRTVPILSDVLEAVDELADGRSYGLLVQCDRSSMARRSDFVRLRAQAVLQVAGVKQHPLDRRSPHVLRRTFATKLIDNGVPLTVVQEILGHASIETTRRYIAHAKVSRLVEAVQRGPLSALPVAA